MTLFETALWCARDTAVSAAIKFNGIIANAFVMAHAVGNGYCIEGADAGEWINTAEVVRVGSMISYDYIETADGCRYLILSHECDEARRSFEHMRRFIEVNNTYFQAKRSAVFAAPNYGFAS